ncbi:MAG TPA: hypothetical protein ENJ01_05235 [Gammaproteobacteria bacterium]|nr:hypothetical protein [Gammaproteobacteria bacterium]
MGNIPGKIATVETTTEVRRPFRVLSLDGGGVRCIIQLAILDELERVAGPLYRCFDAIVGSSVGALVGCGVSVGFGMQESTELFYSFVDEVFSKHDRFHEKLKRLSWWSFSKHSDDRVSEVLKKIYGDTTMQELLVKPTMVVCHNPQKARPEIISSDELRYASVPVWEACKAATSAPLYFKPKQVKTRYYSDFLLDGGLVSNNPALFGLSRGMQILRQRHGEAELSDVLIVSLGSGKIREGTSNTLSGHLNALTTAPFFGSSEATHYGLRDLLGKHYYRLQVEIPNHLKRPDESYNIHELHAITEDVIERHYQPVIEHLASLITRPPQATPREEVATSTLTDAGDDTRLHDVLIRSGIKSAS